LNERAISVAVEVRGAVGRTDLEVTIPGAMLVFEAKRGWLLPSSAQLASYAPRVRARGGGALITLSQASHALARTQLPADVDGVPISRGRERLWLDQFRTYLKGVINIRSVADS
jgi:hypothetical protein